MEKSISEEHSEKEPYPILSTNGTKIWIKNLQNLNAYLPIFLTLNGIEIFISEKHPEKV